MWFLKLDSNGCYDPDNCSEVYHINGVNPSTSDTEKLPIPYSLYPNPVGDVLHIDSEISYSGFRIYDLLGRERLRLDKMVDQVNVSSMEPGAYFITFLSKNRKIKTLKWIKR